MTWIPLLLADRSPILRRLVLIHLVNRPVTDSEVLELEDLVEDDHLLHGILERQAEDGSWQVQDIGGTHSRDRVRATSFVLQRLAYFGFRADHDSIVRGVEFIFSKQKKNGSWPIPKTYDAESLDGGVYTMMPLQTSIPLLGVTASGHAQDERAENAYEWLLEQRLEDGAWPTGKIGKVLGYRAGYRRMPHSEWGCRTNTTLALQCLAMHPRRRRGETAKRALELLLARETRDRRNLGFNVVRTVGLEPHRGHFTYHAKFDPALVLDLCGRTGANRNDRRVDDLVRWLREVQGPYGLWEYVPHPEASRWVTFDLLRSLSSLDESSDWLSLEPRRPFASYPRRRKRF
ncbi:MAG: hypothetical protein ACXADO_07750 [Candidatus Thorarchaeota archaeon]|jgi:hypothetical protein